MVRRKLDYRDVLKGSVNENNIAIHRCLNGRIKPLVNFDRPPS